MEHVKWRNTGLPELIWLGLLEHKLGLRTASRLSLLLAQSAKEVANKTITPWFWAISSYSVLSEEETKSIVGKLAESGDLNNIREALNPLLMLYPECPLSFIYTQRGGMVEDRPETLRKFKSFLVDYSYKYNRTATLAQANSIYIAFVTGIFKVVKGATALENFPAVADFPNTEESNRVAHSIYPTVNAVMGQTVNKLKVDGPTPWARYFWNQGLQLESCSFTYESDGDGL